MALTFPQFSLEWHEIDWSIQIDLLYVLPNCVFAGSWMVCYCRPTTHSSLGTTVLIKPLSIVKFIPMGQTPRSSIYPEPLQS